MSFVKNKTIQMCLNSSYLTLTQREKKFLYESWAESFRDNTFPYINEERFSVLYSRNAASRTLSRLELIYQCVARAVSAISNCVPELLRADFSKYLKEGYRNEVIYSETGKSIADKMEVLRHDSVLLQEVIAANGKLSELLEIQLFTRMFTEQTETKEDQPVWIDQGAVPASALQSPTDEDATHRKKAGKDYVGYVGNIVESFEKMEWPL